MKLSQWMQSSNLIVAGGGTGGHVLPGIALADAWKQRFKEAEILFVGAQNRIEERLVPKAGYRLNVLKLGSLNRVTFLTRCKTLFQIPLSMIQAGIILLRFQPRYVIGVGGYSSGPLVLMACFLNFFKRNRIRTAILETNSIAGFTNRVLGRFVDQIFLSFPETEAYFQQGTQKKKQIYYTGNPIRSTMKQMKKAPRSPFYFFIFGGSQGALGMNSVVLKALPLLKKKLPDLKIIHQTGKIDYERVLGTYKSLDFPAEVVEFIDTMPDYYQKSSLILCRSGSSTLAELAAVGRASILVPLPTAADGHQKKNAEILEKKKAAICFEQNRPASELAELVIDLMENPVKIAEMEEHIGYFYKPKAAADLVKMLSSSGTPIAR